MSEEIYQSGASWLAIAGVDLFKIDKILGHKDLKMTQRYSHLSEQSIRNAVEMVMGANNGYRVGI